MKRLSQTTWLVLGMAFGLLAEAQADPTADFKRDIQPLLESRCSECHGPRKDKAGIRFDRKTTVFKGGDSGQPIVVPGKSADSPLIRRVTSSDPEEVMPPKGDRLTSKQIALLKDWIEAGAAWP